MKAFRLFLWLWFTPALLSAVVIYLDNGFAGEWNWKTIKIITGLAVLLAIPASGVAFLLPVCRKVVTSRNLSTVAAAGGVQMLSFLYSILFLKNVFSQWEFLIPFMQSVVCLCLFFIGFFVTRTSLSADRKVFRPDRRFFTRFFFWICLPESFFGVVLLWSEYPKYKTVEGYAGFISIVAVYALLTNFAAYLAIVKSLKIAFLARFTPLVVLLALAASLVLGLLFIHTWVGQIDIGMIMVLLFPSLFSASAMTFMIYNRISSDAKDSEIRKLGKSFGKKSSELEILKRQTHPHFFFNNLNTLISLIESDPKKASEFGQRLSNVYRKFFSENEEDFIALSKELEFISEYIEIYRAKFGNSFAVSIRHEDRQDYHVLADALQETVDNIFKHNLFEEENPISIEIFRDEANLIVRNSRVYKLVPDSGQTGLENIRKRYELLTGEQISISETPGIFVVNLPILSFE